MLSQLMYTDNFYGTAANANLYRCRGVAKAMLRSRDRLQRTLDLYAHALSPEVIKEAAAFQDHKLFDILEDVLETPAADGDGSDVPYYPGYYKDVSQAALRFLETVRGTDKMMESFNHIAQIIDILEDTQFDWGYARFDRQAPTGN